MTPLRSLALLAALLATLPAAAQAQSHATDRGSMLLGGSAGFSSHGYRVEGVEEQERATVLHFMPSVQYFVLPGLALGGDVNVTRYSNRDGSSAQYGVGPAVSYYFGGPEKSVLPFLSGSLLYLRSSANDDSQTGYSASAGAVFLFNRSVGLRGSLYYNGWSMEDVRSNTYGVGIGFTAFAF